MQSPKLIVEKVLFHLKKLGVEELIVCSGARNSAFVLALEQDPFRDVFRHYYHFEERSAAFFALGRAQASFRPVGVITTSGTAAAECFPACIEAYYTSTPLLLITADRPRRFRGTGAPQSIEQVGLFKNYTKLEFDIEGADFDFTLMSSAQELQGPVHLNICLEDPMNKLGEKSLPQSASDQNLQGMIRPLAIVSTLKEQEKEIVLDFLKQTKMPCYLEATSGLRGQEQLKGQYLLGGETSIRRNFESYFDGVLRLGGVPTTRIWRDLESELSHVPILSICSSSFLGLSRTHRRLSFSEFSDEPTRSLLAQNFKWESERGQDFKLFDRDRKSQILIRDLLGSYPQSEPSMVFELSKKVGKDPLYLGNSLPIREWDMVAQPNGPSNVHANRGANGIDGQVSTYLGWAKDHPGRSWGVFGDLTALYDLAAPFLMSQLKGFHGNILVLNNGGGQIFKRMFQHSAFLNSHQVNFADWANLWGLSFKKIKDQQEIAEIQEGALIELCPDSNQTTLFWQQYDSISFVD